MATSGFQAGIEANDVELSYGKETVWGQKPAVAFQAVRMTSESFAGSKTRQRPEEIRQDAQASAAITTQEQATAGITLALSYGTYDDLLAGLLMGEWSTAVDVSASDISASNTNSEFGSTSTDFTGENISVGQWIKVSGFATAGNNGFFRVTSVSANALGVSPAPAADEAAGATVTMKGSMLRNGSTFQSFYFQKRLADDKFLVYPGTYWAQGSLSAALGQFMQGSFGGFAKSEEKQTSNQSTGSVLPAPTGRVHDTVGNFGGVMLDGAPIDAVVQEITVNVTKQGAAGQYGIGSPAAQGVNKGFLEASGTLRVFFKDFTVYDLFKAESQHFISFRTADAAGNAYVLTVPAATVMNPQVAAGGPGQPVLANFTLEGNPHPTLGHTLQLDRFAA
jgi:hypothetical protein